jgi:hypothetical protein
VAAIQRLRDVEPVQRFVPGKRHAANTPDQSRQLRRGQSVVL